MARGVASVPSNAEERHPPTPVGTVCWSPRVASSSAVSVTLAWGYHWAWGCGEVCTVGSCKLGQTGSTNTTLGVG